MRLSINCVLGALAFCVAGFVGSAQAALIAYTSDTYDRAVWLSTLVGGTPTVTEDFSGEPTERSFISGPQTFGGIGTFEQTVNPGSGTNLGGINNNINRLELPPFTGAPSEVNGGGAHLRMLTNFAGDPALDPDDIVVEWRLPAAVNGVGMDLDRVNSGEGLLLDLYLGPLLIQTVVTADLLTQNAGSGFLGLSLTGGDMIDRIVFRSQNPVDQFTELFGLDNIAFGDTVAIVPGGTAIPEPSGFAVLAMGLALAIRRRKLLGKTG